MVIMIILGNTEYFYIKNSICVDNENYSIITQNLDKEK